MFHLSTSHRLVVQRLVTGNAPYVRGDSVLFFQDPARLQHLVEYGAASEQLDAHVAVLLLRFAEPVHPLEDPFPGSLGVAGHGRHGVVFVMHGQVVEHVVLFFVHAPVCLLR